MRTLFRRRAQSSNFYIWPILASLILAAWVANPALGQENEPFTGATWPTKRADRIAPVEDHRDLWRRGEYQAALDELQNLLETMPRGYPPRFIRDRAALQFEVGRVDRAISDLESLSRQIPSMSHMVRLAEFYRYRGRKEDFEKTLEKARQVAKNSRSFGGYGENVVALGRIYELTGENPKFILNSIYGKLLENTPSYIAGYVAAGDLAYRKKDFQLASEYYQKALERQEDNIDAMAGLAECYWKSSDPRLEDSLRKIEAINPHHLGAKAIRAELLLDVGNTNEALEIIEAGLAINPVNGKLLSLQSAAYFLQSKRVAMEQVQAGALEFNPYHSEIYRTTGRVASRHYRFKEAAAFQRRALEVDPEDHEARALLAFDLLRIGEEEEGLENLEAAFEADPFNVHVFNMLQLMDTLSEYALIEEGPFRIQMPAGEAPILAKDVSSLLGDAYDELSAKYEVELETPILIQVFDDHDDFMVRSVGLPGSVGYMGICFGKLVTMDSPTARPKWQMNWRSVLWHEFTHVVTLQLTRNRMPRWLSEGISVYEETQRDSAWGQKIDPRYKPLVAGESLPGLSDLEGYFTRAKSADHLMFGYFAAGEFARFYVETYGFEKLVAALKLMGLGVNANNALVLSAESTIEEMDAAFRDYMAIRLKSLDNLPAIAAASRMELNVTDGDTSATMESQGWAVGKSPFTEAMRKAAEAQQNEQWEEAELELRKAQGLFPDYVAADSPLRQLAGLYKKQGRREEFREALREQVGASPTDFPSYRELTVLLKEDERWGDLAETAHAALGIDPFDTEMRQMLYLGLFRSGRLTRALDTLGELAWLDPMNATDYNLQRVELLIERRQWETAKQETVALLEEAPHFWLAQQALLEILERPLSAENVHEYEE